MIVSWYEPSGPNDRDLYISNLLDIKKFQPATENLTKPVRPHGQKTIKPPENSPERLYPTQ